MSEGGAKGAGSTLLLAALFLAIGIAGGLGVAYAVERTGSWPFSDGETVTSEEIRELNELSTVQMTASVPVTQESGSIRRVPEFLRGESVLLIAVGDVRAGVDLGEVGEDDVRVDDERVTIDLPEAEILSSGLDDERTEVYDRDQGLLDFNPDEDLEQEARREAIRDIEAAAREDGLLDQANANARSSIRAFVESLGFEEVEFE